LFQYLSGEINVCSIADIPTEQLEPLVTYYGLTVAIYIAKRSIGK